MDQNELHKLMDCCRPDQADLDAVEMSALNEALARDAEARARWREVCRWDARLRSAMRDVPVPEGLADRLLDAASQRDQRGRNGAEGPAAGDAAPELATTTSSGRFRRRPIQRWTAVAAGLCTVAAAVAIVVWFGPWQNELTSRQVARLARTTWMSELDREAWQTSRPPLAKYPLDPSLRFASIRWQRFRALDDPHAVAYQAALPPDRAAAYLLVVRTRRSSRLPTTPPMVPQSTTEGLCIGTWQSRGLLYVLTVPGNQLKYRRAINSQSFVMRSPAQRRVVRHI